jgi:flavin-dependent dehydrogenase
MRSDVDVAIIGAGPSGAAAAAYLASRGHSVEVVERAHFPRFSIGESLLPQSMSFLDEAGLLEYVQRGNFQHKDGAVFRRGEEEQSFWFCDMIGDGWSTTYQVRREIFDQLLIQGAADKGARVTFGAEVTGFTPGENGVRLQVREEAGKQTEIAARYALDASGFGRVLPRLLSLDRPSDFPVRKALFSHVRDHIDDPTFDRNKILITVHPTDREIWYWLIPLSDGLTSIGVVGPERALRDAGPDEQSQLSNLIAQASRMRDMLRKSEQVRPIGTIAGYARTVDRLTGPGYALLGNAAEFLDPVFSSGVTIALKSAILAGRALDRQFKGETVDWTADFEVPLKTGIDAFRSYVESWYDSSLQDIIFAQPKRVTTVKRQIISVLAGYAWDTQNPFVREPKRYLSAVQDLSRRPT